MGLNLASLLTESVVEHADAPAIRLGDVELTYAALDESSARTGRSAACEGHAAGRPRRGDAAQRPRVPDRLLRRPAGRRSRRAYERPPQAARDRLLSRRLGGRDASRLARLLRRGMRRSGGCRSRVDRSRAGRLRRGAERVRARHGAGRHGGGRHRRDPLHLGDDRQAEGRRADPRQPPPQRRDLLADHGRGRTGRRRPRRPAALPLLRSVGRYERHAARRRLPHPDPQIRPGRDPGDHGTRRGHPFLRGPDDVRRPAPPPRARGLRHLGPVQVHHRRRLDAGRGPARLRRRLRRGRPRGLRPLGDLPGRLLGPSRHGAQGRARSGRRSRGSRCGSSTRTTTRSSRARSARS